MSYWSRPIVWGVCDGVMVVVVVVVVCVCVCVGGGGKMGGLWERGGAWGE